MKVSKKISFQKFKMVKEKALQTSYWWIVFTKKIKMKIQFILKQTVNSN
jgi:hypothetical protein